MYNERVITFWNTEQNNGGLECAVGYSAGRMLWRKTEPSHALCILVQEPLTTVVTVLGGVQGFSLCMPSLHLSSTFL